MVGSCAAYTAPKHRRSIRAERCQPRPDGVIRLAGSTGPARSVRRRHVVAGLGFDGETRSLAESLKERAPGQTRLQAQTRPIRVVNASLHAAPAGEGKPPPFFSLRNLLNTPSRAPSTLKQSPSFFAITLTFSHPATTQEALLSS